MVDSKFKLKKCRLLHSLFLLFSFFLSGCYHHSDIQDTISMRKAELLRDAVNALYQDYGNEMAAEHGIWVCNMRGPVFDQVDLLGCQLVTPRKICLEQARVFIAVAYKIFREQIDKHSELLFCFPSGFDFRNIVLGITFIDEKGSRITEKDIISSASYIGGHLVYRTFNPLTEKPESFHEENIKESHEELLNFEYSNEKWNWSLLTTTLPKNVEFLCIPDYIADDDAIRSLYPRKNAEVCNSPTSQNKEAL